MGLFNIIKNIITKDEKIENQNNNFDNFSPNGKASEWFASNVGLEVLKQYISVRGYSKQDELCERLKQYPEMSLETLKIVLCPNEKIPALYYVNLIKSIDIPLLAPEANHFLLDFLATMISLMVKNFKINEDGEPEKINTYTELADSVLIDKNPVLYFITKFNLFSFKDDVEGSMQDKFQIMTTIIPYIIQESKGKIEFIDNNGWLLSKNTYFNDFNVVLKKKSFIKKCIELSKDDEYFKNQLSAME